MSNFHLKYDLFVSGKIYFMILMHHARLTNGCFRGHWEWYCQFNSESDFLNLSRWDSANYSRVQLAILAKGKAIWLLFTNTLPTLY